MANITKGSQTSNFPDSLPNFTAQSEALDPATEDNTLAEGRDANIWSAEIEAIAGCLGTGGRGEITVSGSSATIEALSYVYRGTQKEFLGETGKALQANQKNYIYLDPVTNTIKTSISGWPSNSAHLKLATWDDLLGAGTLTDQRPHTLQVTGEKHLISRVSGQLLISGRVTIPSGQDNTSFSYGITFETAPKITLGGHRASDGSLKAVGTSNLTTTSGKIYIDSNAPVGGYTVDWVAIGVQGTDVSGSGS